MQNKFSLYIESPLLLGKNLVYVYKNVCWDL